MKIIDSKDGREIKMDNKYSTDSFVVYIHTKNGNFSTSASSKTTSAWEDENYQAKNKITERILYATK